MSQYRRDRFVIGGRRATAGGRAQALRARGYNQVIAFMRARRVFELRWEGHSVRTVAQMMGISKSQVQRDYDWIWCRSPWDAEEEETGNALLHTWLQGQSERPRWTYAQLAEASGMCERRVGELVRAARERARRRAAREAKAETARLAEEASR